MAKVGLNFGEKLPIVDKNYRILNDGLDISAVLGEMTFGRIEGSDVIYESERQPDNTFREVSTGEVRGVVVGVRLTAQKETVFVTVTDMSESEIEDLGLQFREAIELDDVVVTYSGIGQNDIYKLFASKIRKKSVSAGVQPQGKPEGNKSEQSKDNKPK